MASLVPPNLRKGKILVLYRRSELPDKRTYAVFRIGDELIVNSEYVLDWVLPGRGHYVTTEVQDDPRSAKFDGYDVVLLWDALTETFQRIYPNASEAPSRSGGG
jgi:hypothetical protein